MPSLSAITSSPEIREYAQGAAQSAAQPVADFIAPPVDVPTSIGRFKIYSEEYRFKLPKTLRGLGGRATTLDFDASDGTFNCAPNALDFPIDNLEKVEEQALENIVEEAAVSVAEVASLVHESTVINKALAAAGAGTAKTWSGQEVTDDPIDDLDAAILAVTKAAAYGSIMNVGVLFGATAFKTLKNNPLVRSRFVSAGGNAIPNINQEQMKSLLIGNPDVRMSFMVADSSAPGLAKNINFLLDNDILIFARTPSPTRRDPSFMKTFRLMGHWMVPGTYMRDDQRVEVLKFDWSEDVHVTNSSAVKRLTIS